MRRYTFPAFKTAPTLRYVVLWDLHWQLLEVQRLDPAADLGGAMAAAIAPLGRWMAGRGYAGIRLCTPHPQRHGCPVPSGLSAKQVDFNSKLR